MAKKVIRLTEQELYSLIAEATNQTLLEIDAKNYIEQHNITSLYHATASCYVDSIRKYGLGGKIPSIRFWDYKGTEYVDIDKGCFLATDEYVAESYVETSDSFDDLVNQYDEDIEIVVFEININDLDMSKLKIDTNQLYDDSIDPTFFYEGIIPFNKLKKIKLY